MPNASTDAILPVTALVELLEGSFSGASLRRCHEGEKKARWSKLIADFKRNLAVQHHCVQHLQLRIRNGCCTKIHVFLFLFHNTSSVAPTSTAFTRTTLDDYLSLSSLNPSPDSRYDRAAGGGRAQSTLNLNHK